MNVAKNNKSAIERIQDKQLKMIRQIYENRHNNSEEVSFDDS
jgi:hypothetical protein